MNPGNDWMEQGRRLLEDPARHARRPGSLRRGRARLGLPMVPGVPGGGRRARRAARADGGAGRRPCRDRHGAAHLRGRGRRPAGSRTPGVEAEARRTASGPRSSRSRSRDRARRGGAGRARDRYRRHEGRRGRRRARRDDRRDRPPGHPRRVGRRHRGRHRRRRRGARGVARRRAGRGRVGAAGWFDRTGDTVLFSPHLAWRNSSLRKDLAARLQRPLWVGNDADAAAWAEYRYGAARGRAGADDHAGHRHRWRHRPGRPAAAGVARRGGRVGSHARRPHGRLCACGTAAAWSSTPAARRSPRPPARSPTSRAAAGRLLERVDGDADRLTGEDVARAAAEGDPLALELVTDVGVWLGQGIADLAAILDPEVVVIGGGRQHARRDGAGAGAGSPRAAVPGRGFRPGLRVAVAELGPQAGLVGAADLVRVAVTEAAASARSAEP